MSPRAVDKRARPGNEHDVERPAVPETPSAVTTLQAADQTTDRVSQRKRSAKTVAS